MKERLRFLLNIVLNFKSKHIKGSIVQIERKLGKITCESNIFRRPQYKKTKIKTNQTLFKD